MRVAIVSHRPSATNLGLAARDWNGIAAELMSPREALLTLGRGDVALGRLDVRDQLDGVEEGLWALDRLADGGIQVLNRSAQLLAAHDKLLTARVLRRAGLPHPRTVLIERCKDRPDLDFPAVLKPRFGSWGRDVVLWGASSVEASPPPVAPELARAAALAGARPGEVSETAAAIPS